MNDQENNVSFFRFEDLRIYAKVMDYITWLHQESDLYSFEREEIKFIRMAFLRSAHNIALYTAEGSSRNRTQFLYYLKMAKSAVRECVVYTESAYRCQCMSEENREISRNRLMELTKMIGSLISSLQRSEASRTHEEREEEPTNQFSDFDSL